MSHTDERETTLSRALKALADVEAGVETPHHVETAVMARWEAEHAPRARLRKAGVVRGAATIAAGVTLLAAVALEREWRHVDVALPASPRDVPVLPAVSEPSAVSDIARRPYGDEMPGRDRDGLAAERTQLVMMGPPLAADERVRIVRMRVASSSLGELGVRDITSGDTVDIDVLVGEDGVARGVRMSM